MSQLLALEWDGYEARVVSARKRGKGITLEQAFALPLRASEELPAARETAEAIGDALRQHGLKGEALVSVGRSNIELRMLTVPPAPDDELPEMVRFQALRQFTAIAENWPLDFIPLSTGEEGLNVLAAAMSPEMAKEIQSTCEAAGLTPQRMVLRPCAAATLWQRVQGENSKSCDLIVDPLADEADLTVLDEGAICLIRTVRLPNEGPARTSSLIREIHRTMVAARNRLGGRAVHRIVLCSGGVSQAEVEKTLAAEQLEVVLLDPFTVDASLVDLACPRPAEKAGRFASLIGALLDESQGRHTIDFLNPRRAAPPPNRNRLYALAAGAVACFLLAIGYLIYSQFSSLEEQRQILAAESNQLTKLVEKAKALQENVAEIDAFAAGDITWLDELAELSREFPPPDDAIVSQLQLGPMATGGGQMVLDGFVRQSPTIPAMERALRDDNHKVIGSGGQFDQRQERYSWRFKETVVVAPPSEAEESAREDAP